MGLGDPLLPNGLGGCPQLDSSVVHSSRADNRSSRCLGISPVRGLVLTRQASNFIASSALGIGRIMQSYGPPAGLTLLRRAMYIQLRLWETPKVDLLAKIRAELEMGKDVFYHFNGHSLIMRERIPRREVTE